MLVASRYARKCRKNGVPKIELSNISGPKVYHDGPMLYSKKKILILKKRLYGPNREMRCCAYQKQKSNLYMMCEKTYRSSIIKRYIRINWDKACDLRKKYCYKRQAV